MGTSFTTYRRHGFWTSDGKLEIWLMALCDEVDRLSDAPEWLREAREHWYAQSTVGFIGCVDAGLDQIVGGELTRAAVLRDLGARANLRLQSSRSISRLVLRSYGVGGPGTQWTVDADSATLVPVAMAFDALLAGTLTTDASSSDLL